MATRAVGVEAVADPTYVGQWLLSRADHPARGDLRLSEIADTIDWPQMPPYDPGDSIVRETHRRYHDELQERARQGDRYAKSMLLGHAYQEPADAA